MTTPDVPLRMELTFEMPGTPEQVWDAIATANGISAWMVPTDLEEREGGALVFHMGETDSPGTVTGWEPPRRFAYSEPDWADLAQHPDAEVTPLVTEFLIEAQSGGTCLLRVVTSGFGTGAAWEREFFDDMQRYWTPQFETLRLYLTHFPGQRVTPMYVQADIADNADTVRSAMQRELGATRVGDTVELRGVKGQVERIGTPPAPSDVLVRVASPVAGYMSFMAYDKGDGMTNAMLASYLFSDDAAGYVEREQSGWKAWLEGLTVPAG